MFVVVGSLSAQAPAANEGTSGALKPAPLFSRGAATECSPGRKPGVGVVSERSPGGAKDSERLFRPSGAEIVSKENPGLAPGATPCRRSAAVRGDLFLDRSALPKREYALPTQYLRSEFLTQHTSNYADKSMLPTAENRPTMWSIRGLAGKDTR